MQTNSSNNQAHFSNLETTGACVYADINGGGLGNRVALATINDSRAESEFGKLFAAAPDLLDALIECEAILVGSGVNGGAQAIAVARMAIEKATGGNR